MRNTFWLIEDATIPVYWGTCNGAGTFRAGLDGAVKFSTKDDAEKALTIIKDFMHGSDRPIPAYKVVEHGYMDAQQE